VVWILSVGPFPNRAGHFRDTQLSNDRCPGGCADAAGVGVLVAVTADDEALAAPFGHEVHPSRSVGPVVAAEVGELADVVHFDVRP
jgi:hypothetical protein